MAAEREREAAQNVLNSAWVKGSAAIVVPFLIALVGVVLSTAGSLSEVKVNLGNLQRDVTEMRRTPAQVLEEERRVSTILGGISDRLSRIEVRLQIESGRDTAGPSR